MYAPTTAATSVRVSDPEFPTRRMWKSKLVGDGEPVVCTLWKTAAW